MNKNKLQVTIKATNGKSAILKFPMNRSEFKNIMNNLSEGNTDICWWIEEVLAYNQIEGRIIAQSRNISLLNLYGEYISRMDEDGIGMYLFLLDAFNKDIKSMCDLINLVANIDNYCFVPGIESYLSLGKFLTKDDSEFASADDKTLRNIGKKHVKNSGGKIFEGYFIQRCKKSWKAVYNGNPNMIPEQYQLCSDTNEGGN